MTKNVKFVNNKVMRKNYIVPQSEVMQLSSEMIMDTIGIVHHSGGSNSGGSGGFSEDDIR